MRVLFCNAPNVPLLDACGGVLREMRLREQSLRIRGHEVEYLPHGTPPPWSSYDVAHLFMANGDSYSLGAAVRSRLPFVVSPIIDRTQSNAVLRMSVWLEQRIPTVFTHVGRCAAICRMADAVCLRSQEEQERLHYGLGVSSPCIISPCPLIVPSQASDVPQHLNEHTGSPFVLFLGDAGNPRKNVERLIHAMEGLDFVLLIAGMLSNGPTADRIRHLVAERKNIRLLGVLSENEKSFLLRQATVFALPSLMEGIGLAAAEAALSGTTVVITKYGGAPDYFGDRAFYVEPHSVRDIRRKIEKAFQSPLDSSVQMRRFSLEHGASSLEECYQMAIHRRRNCRVAA